MRLKGAFSSSGLVRCVVLRFQQPIHPFDILSGRVTNVEGNYPNATWAVAGVPFVVYYTGLSINTEYRALCAQNDLNTSFTSFRIGGIRVQTAIQHIGDTSLALATKFNSSGFGRCVLVTPETTEVSDISVLNGKNAVGTLPPLSYVHSTESL